MKKKRNEAGPPLITSPASQEKFTEFRGGAQAGLRDKVKRRSVGHVIGIRDAGTAGEEAADASAAVDDDAARVALGREGAGLAVERQDGPLLGNLGFVAAEVVGSECRSGCWRGRRSGR